MRNDLPFFSRVESLTRSGQSSHFCRGVLTVPLEIHENKSPFSEINMKSGSVCADSHYATFHLEIHAGAFDITR